MLEREFQKKRKIQSRIYSKTTVVILAILVIILVRATWNMYKANAESKRNFQKVSTDLEKMRERENELHIEIDRLNTEKGTEEEIRKKFNVAKEGEGVVYVVEPEKKTAGMQEEVGFFGQIWQWFVSIF